jgi:hypothetical protein
VRAQVARRDDCRFAQLESSRPDGRLPERAGSSRREEVGVEHLYGWIGSNRAKLACDVLPDTGSTAPASRLSPGVGIAYFEVRGWGYADLHPASSAVDNC